MDWGVVIDVRRVRDTRVRDVAVVDRILEDLLEQDLPCAPSVVARLISELTDDASTISAVVARLDVAQRFGLRPLPSTLPMVESIARLFAHLDPDHRDRDLLVAAAVRLDDRLEPLLEFDGRSAEALLDSGVADLLDIRAGRVRFADPRLSIWISTMTPAAAVAAVHLRLHEVFVARGEQGDAGWHRARASLHGIPDAAAELLSLAREHSETGATDRALMFADEAAVHGVGDLRDEAILVAGIAAIAGGYAAEAVERLSRLFPDGEEGCRLGGLGYLFVAQAHLQGAVPEVDPDAVAPQTQDPQRWHDWARTAAYAAIMSAERGDRRAMRSWLGALQEACARTDGADLRDPVVALAWLIAGERDVENVPGEGPLTGGMLRALRAGLDGDLDGGLRLLAAGDAGLGVDQDPLVSGCERAPLVAAYRAVVGVLLLTWRGDIAAARSRLRHAALDLPVALPFAGLGVVLARRLDLAVLGRLGPVARALTASLPPSLRIDQLVDRAIQAHLAGAFEEAASLMRLWEDRGAPQPTFDVPGLGEVAAASGIASTARRRTGPPEMSLARELSTAISSCADRDWPAEYPGIVATTRSIASPFSRGRVEAMIGTRCLIRGDDVAGGAHLETAQSLFEVAGADAWAAAIAERRRRPETGGPRSANGDANPLAAARRLWAPILTTREREVAMLAAGGASNREIASALHLSVRTVEVHLGRVFAKLEVRTRVELTVLAHRIDRYA